MEQGEDELSALIAARRAALSGGVDTTSAPDEVDSLIASRRTALEGDRGNVLQRAGEQISRVVKHAVANPGETLAEMAKATGRSVLNAVLTPEVGEARPNPYQVSARWGTPVSRAAATATHYDESTRGAQPQGGRTRAGIEAVSGAMFPALAGGVTKKLGGKFLAQIAGSGTAGGVAGAAYSPGSLEDRAVGFLTGAALAPLAEVGGKAVGKIATSGVPNAVTATAARVDDWFGRPEATQPRTMLGVEVGTRLGRTDRAAQQVGDRLESQGVDFFDVQRKARAASRPAPGTVPASMSRPRPPEPRPTADADAGALARIRKTLESGRRANDAVLVDDMQITARRSAVEPIEYIRPAEDRFNPAADPSEAMTAALGRATPEPPRVLDKPVSLLELAGDPAVRHARGIKSAFPQAESTMKSALAPREANAVDRIIGRGLELTGLRTRESGVKTLRDLVEQTTAQADEAYGRTFASHTSPIDSDVVQELLATPAGKQAWGIAERLMANQGVKAPTQKTAPQAPEGIDPADWGNMLRLSEERGMPLPEGLPSGERITPTLQQLHYWKLAFDDLKRSGLDRGPGAGGIGYNEGASIHGLQKQLLGVMDEASPDYASSRRQFADNKSLEEAAEFGRKLWDKDPDEAAAAFAEMSEAERQVARRTGFDRLAQRIENGPADAEKGIHKPRDLKRIRILFPDEGSFEQFRASVATEAQMHASGKTIFGGSQTADKLADIMGAVGLPLDVLTAGATGRLGAVVAGTGRLLYQARARTTNGELAGEQAKLLTAGSTGSADELQAALDRILKTRPRQAPPSAAAARARDVGGRVGRAAVAATPAALVGPEAERRRTRP